MSYKGYADWRGEKQKVSMSEDIGVLERFKDLQESACVHVEERELIAWCHAYGIINPQDKGFKDFLEKIAIPVLVRVGRAKWYRSEVSDLGLALSTRKRVSKSEDTGKVLEE